MRSLYSIRTKLTQDCTKAMKRFEVNHMKANANKFQVMFLSRNNRPITESIMINETDIKTARSVNVLGVEIDRDLRFKEHINETNIKIAKQINAVKWMNNFLDKK